MTSPQTRPTWAAGLQALPLFQNDLQRVCLLVLQSLEECQRPRLSDPEWRNQLQLRMQTASFELRKFLEKFSAEIGPSLEAKFLEIERSFESYRKSFQETAQPSVRELKKKYRQMAAEYESTLAELRTMGYRTWVGRGHVKPLNYWRNLFHAMNATIAFLLYQWFLTREQALLALGAVAVLAVSMEVSRKFSARWNDFLVDRVFGLVSRPLEKHAVNSATWYLFALLLSCFLFSQKALLVAVLILGYADPIASLVGKRWGSWKIRGQKSFQGTLAFFLTALAVSFFYGRWASVPAVEWASLLWYLGIPLATTGAELMGDRIDDNFGILLAGGAFASLSLWML